VVGEGLGLGPGRIVCAVGRGFIGCLVVRGFWRLRNFGLNLRSLIVGLNQR
jgi:hypothetical protein